MDWSRPGRLDIFRNCRLFLFRTLVRSHPESIGRLAVQVMPVIRQFFVKRNTDLHEESAFELKLYLIRKRIEAAVVARGLENVEDFYIASLSSNRVVYKGLVMADQIEHFYTDLSDISMKTSFALVHSRFSTNTLGSWRLAHPYRFIIHNGEINTLRGNTNWMAARESMFSSENLGDDVSSEHHCHRPRR